MPSDGTSLPEEKKVSGNEIAAVGQSRLPIEEFMKVDLRVALVVDATRVRKSKRLLRVEVDLGAEKRTLVAGVAESYEPESLIGRSIVMVSNLQPVKLMGIESNGMVLAASGESGQSVLLFVDPPLPPGTRVR